MICLLWKKFIRNEDIGVLEWIHKYENISHFCDMNYRFLFENKNIKLMQWFLNHKYAIISLNIEICQWLWDNNIRPRCNGNGSDSDNDKCSKCGHDIGLINCKTIFEDTFKSLDHRYIKYNNKKLYQMINWCIQYD